MTGRNCLNGSGIEKIKWNLESVLEKSNNPVGKNSGNLVVFATLNYSPGHCWVPCYYPEASASSQPPWAWHAPRIQQLGLDFLQIIFDVINKGTVKRQLMAIIRNNIIIILITVLLLCIAWMHAFLMSGNLISQTQRKEEVLHYPNFN